MLIRPDTTPDSSCRTHNTMTANFRVDPRLTTLLGETYRSSEQALKELVDNAWDADASTVDVLLPAAMSADPVVIRDDGSGMTEVEVRSEYLAIANDRRSRKGEKTHQRQRRVKGRKGIGKFAGLMVADVMNIETIARGVRTMLVIQKQDLLRPDHDLEQIDLPINTEVADTEAHGTTITLTSLAQHLAFPTPERLRQLLVQEYGRQDDFRIVVNGQTVASEDIPGKRFEESIILPDVGAVTLRFTVAEGKKPLKHSGIVTRVDGKTVGTATYFGLDADEEIPPKLCKKIYGEVIADGLSQDVTADWGSIIENSKAWKALTEWVGPKLADGVTEVFRDEVNLAKARARQELNRRLALLPEYRRQMAEDAITRVLTRFYGESDERIDAVIGVMLDAFERDEYWAVVQAIDNAKAADVAVFAEALDAFGLVDMAVMGRQTQRRLQVLDELDTLLARPETLEAAMHRVLEHNLWILGSEYALVQSNRTLASALKDYVDQLPKSRKRTRPDLLLCAQPRQEHLLIEFKRPSKDIDRDDENQAIKYRDDLKAKFAQVRVMVVGRGRAQGVDAGSNHPDLVVYSYSAVVSKARGELAWLLEQLRTPERTQVIS